MSPPGAGALAGCGGRYTGGMVRINARIEIPDEEIQLSAVRSQGAGGQNVNKVATTIHLRFDLASASLPDDVRQRLLARKDRRISADGVVVIKAQRYRSQDRNREDAIERLRSLILGATTAPRRRVPTRPGRAARERRLEDKKKRSALKKSRTTKFE